MTKSKTSTIAIVVLSVLLAAALASTIVLAAFTFSRSATTTITFNGGITVAVSGITGSADPYTWNTTVGGEAKTAGTVTVTGAESVSFDAIKVTVSGQAAYVAIKAEISETDGPDKNPTYVGVIDATTIAGLEEAEGWMIVGSGTAANLVQINSETTLVNPTEIYTYGTDVASDYDAASYTGTVKIAAAISINELATTIEALA